MQLISGLVGARFCYFAHLCRLNQIPSQNETSHLCKVADKQYLVPNLDKLEYITEKVTRCITLRMQGIAFQWEKTERLLDN